MLSDDVQQAVNILYRKYEEVTHDQHLTLFDSIHIRRTLRNAIRYLTAPQRAVFRAPLSQSHKRWKRDR